MSLNDADPHLAMLNPASGATTDIGSEGVPLVEGLTTDSTGNLYGLSGSGGTVIGPLPCPTPTPTPTVTPTPTPTVTPTPTPTPTVTPTASVAPAASVPPTEVLGLQTSRPNTPPKGLPVTGINALPLVALAAAFILVGLVLTRSRPARSRTHGSGDVEGEIDRRG
jgi:hypothetical protein